MEINDKLIKLKDLEVSIPKNMYNRIIQNEDNTIKRRFNLKLVIPLISIYIAVITVVLVVFSVNEVNIDYLHKANITYEKSTIAMEEDALDMMFYRSSVLLNSNKNAVYSPIADYLNLLIGVAGSRDNSELISSLGFSDYNELLTMYQNIMNALNYKASRTSIKTTSAIGLVNVPEYNDEALRSLCDDAKISSFKTTKDELYKTTEGIFKKELELNLDFKNELSNLILPAILNLTGLVVEDIFSEYRERSFKPTNFLFNNKNNVKGQKKEEWVRGYYRQENYEMVSVNINSTDLIFILPTTNIDEVDISEIQLSNMESAYGIYEIPYFKVESSLDTTQLTKDIYKNYPYMEDIALGYLFERSFSKSIFEFNKYGIKGQAIAGMIGVGSSAPEEIQFNIRVDKPFYFISVFQDVPLFMGKITNI